uniref:NADH-ubiquinone oxidoreductase chain 2 n=1 Tax=Anoplophora chinensis TaxID=217632 RepID=A0A0U2XLA1_ANOCN|nr:NADH dehydrogenase subunit 2 [Anoplophora chinensis]ALS54017.1 NADH dehydrogenase subunit 2 [Anoplophora chinensis]UNB14366.1 NADH dehydrogenase subunit 2 [Anoplophora chinensis]
MMHFYKILFFLTMMLGTLMAISSYSWLSMWMGLEINLLSIIPLLGDSKNLYPAESALKYFITQSLASSILLLAIILSLNLKEFFLETFQFLSIIMNSALLTKMGAAPFHTWFPEVMEGLNWMMGLLMLTWQKIAPMILIFYNYQMSQFLLIIILISTIVSGILGLNQISLRKILAYSSINHISWMLASLLHSQMIWMIYFLIYSIITINLVIIFKIFHIFTLSQLFNSLNFSKSIKFSFLLNFFSLGGLPPFLGFFPKWLVINNLILNKFYFLSILLIVFTLITLYFYLRISFSSLMINFHESFLFPSKKLNFKIFLINFVSLSGLLACSLIFNYF